jgi:hypothetical protein
MAYLLPGVIAMQYCKECGAELPTNALFCGRCGRKTASEIEETENLSDALIEDLPIPPLITSTTPDESQSLVSEDEEEEEQHLPTLVSENGEDEQQMLDLASENGEDEQQTQQEYLEPTSSISDEVNPGPEMPANQVIDERLEYSHPSSGTQEVHNPQGSASRRGARPVSKCLLFSLGGLLVVAGVVAALMGLFHLILPGISGSTISQSNSSIDETIKISGSSLTASICVNSSTPSSSGTSGGTGTGFTLFASSGCSSIVAATANSLCLIFPNNAGASHKYIYDVSNTTIDNKSYHLVLGVEEYTGPSTYNDARHISIGLSEGSTGQNFSWLYRSGSVTINNDQQSGTMDVILGSVSSGNTLHVIGDWTCGRIIKNT